MTSFGIHQPTGLCHAVSEGILPPEPSPDLYTWDIIPDDHRSGDDGDDELLITRDTVLWSRGGLFRKSFKFAAEGEPISQALITHFPTPEDDENPSEGHGRDDGPSGQRSGLSKALVVFLKTQAHIYFLSGTSHIVHMPFEVETACSAPIGVIIQRRHKADHLSPITLKFPRVPPNDFIAPPLSPLSPRVTQLQFSTEGLGKPKTLPLRLSSTLENMWQPPLEKTDSRWPRLVCLTDPFLELGLVVSQPDKPSKGRKRRTSPRTPFLDPAEEIIHVEAVRRPGQPRTDAVDDLVLAITVNRETSMYTIWRLVYLKPEDLFTRQTKKPKPGPARRRSSMQPGMKSRATSPVAPSFRESLGAQLPVKKTRRSERIEKSLDLALAMDPDKGGEVTRRQSRRVSSLLARADLSASHERAPFANESMITHPGGRRLDSHGSQRGRASGGYAPMNMSANYGQSGRGFLEPPAVDILDSLRDGGDFEGFQNIALDDSDLVDGLTKEILLTKIHSVPMDNTNVRYSLSDRPARNQCRVFVVVGPPFAVDEEDRTYLVIGIQDPVDKRLQLVTLHVQSRKKRLATTRGDAAKAGRKKQGPPESDMVVTWGPLRRAQSVVDSCKIVDGDQSMILILSENMAGHREFSIQGPWSELTKVTLPLLFYENLNSLEYLSKPSRQGNTERTSIGVGLPAAQLEGVCHPKARGIVDIRDKQGAFHRIQIQLEPRTRQVRSVLQTCRSILPDSHGERMLAAWWHIMQWMGDRYAGEVASVEWSSLVIELFVLFLALDPSGVLRSQPAAADPSALPKEPSKWNQMLAFETPRSSASPAWMQRGGWRWMLDEAHFGEMVGPDANQPGEEDFLDRHIRYAREFMASAAGDLLVGESGYMPTASGRSLETRRSAAWSIIMGLHLLMEEQKLDTLAAESLFPGPADLRVITCQIARWLRWHDFVHQYELGIQVSVDPKHDGGWFWWWLTQAGVFLCCSWLP